MKTKEQAIQEMAWEIAECTELSSKDTAVWLYEKGYRHVQDILNFLYDIIELSESVKEPAIHVKMKHIIEAMLRETDRR